jgi:hypothetical protein
MNVRPRAGLLLLMLAAACGKGAPKHATKAAPSTDPTQRDAQLLGGEIFEMVDRAADYRSSHRGRYPASVAQMGIDSLTPSTARRLSSADKTLSVTVAFRRSAGHALAACTGTIDVLEDASLNDGKFGVNCVTPSGEPDSLRVAGGTR